MDGSGSPKSRALHSDTAFGASAGYSSSAMKENESPYEPAGKRTSAASGSPSNENAPARTLSWQRRPTSQSSERPKSRPLSALAAENAAARSSPNPVELTSSAESAFSKDQVADMLSSKDPSWFRQTSDRGQNSAALRRSQVEDDDRVDMSSIRSQLPGMSRDVRMPEPAKEAAAAQPESPGLRGKLGSPLPITSAQRLDPPITDGPGDFDSSNRESRGGTLSSGRISPSRPISPTKGMGGFVQSAMMKRSDSVNKRWSVTSPPGLQRADSVASNRGSYGTNQRTQAGSRPTSMLRDGSTTPTSTSRPSSSHDRPDLAVNTTPTRGEESAAASRRDEEDRALPSSPSKTMDPKRWSPTKSSWLDTALNKPESPKPKPTPAAAQQPAWMVELNRSKTQKALSGSDEAAKAPSLGRKHDVKTGGLMRSSPPGTNVKPATLSGTSGPFPTPAATMATAPIGELRSGLNRGNPRSDAEGTEADNKASTSKIKPDTPPKKDFRANLKPRQPLDSDEKGDGNDFKNVFGNLRKTKTQNYVAPDELKNNILRGKAALNLTGGPKKSERKDELKEAILKKKEEFKKAQQEGKGITRAPTSAADKPIPEGLAKRMEMNRSGTVAKRDSATSDTPTETSLPESARFSRSSTHSMASVESRASTDRSVTPVERDPLPSLPALQKETSAPGRMQTKPIGGGLANRFNPALAGMLARGPPPMASERGRDADDTAGTSGSATAGSSEPSAPGPQLTHMTKSRARGPKRKAPSAVAKAAPEDLIPGSDVQTPPSATNFKTTSAPDPRDTPRPAPQVISLADSSRKPRVEKPTAYGDVIPLVDSSKVSADRNEQSTTRPLPSPKPARTSPIAAAVAAAATSPKKINEQRPASPDKARRAAYVLDEKEEEEAASQPSSPKKLDVKRMSRFLDEQNQTPAGPPPERSRSRSPVKSRPLPDPAPSSSKDGANDKVDSEPVVSVRSGMAMFGGSAAPQAKQATPRPLPDVSAASPAVRRPRSPTKVEAAAPRLPAPIDPAPLTAPITSPMRSPTKYALEVSALLTEFFGPERPKRNYRVDAAEVLAGRPLPGAKVRTQKAQLFQFFGDGKKLPVPSHHERVLFEREMYICPHAFVNEAGKKVSEVYFWVGDAVPEATAEDAHIFVNREARAFGGKVVKLSQGKETAEFVQALGGIVLVRRGSSNKYDSLAPNMLCGRRYRGQVAFDEVDFSPSSLCSGFPYLITQQGRCYLWKGKGSDVDELSCARLLGMDLALMGELQEVEDGREPAGFWDIFDGGSQPHSADHWRLKPLHDKYCARLFCSEASSSRQIVEVHPFSQRDLNPGAIYVLDAFFELYVIVGARAESQYAAFHNALDFAQEYAILAAGMEDRPFVPVSTVVLEGIPRDLKAVFRKWRDDLTPTVVNAANPTSPSLRRGRSLRIMPLNQALQALT